MLKAVGPFYLMCMPGEVRDPTQGNGELAVDSQCQWSQFTKIHINYCQKIGSDNKVSALSRQIPVLYTTVHYYYLMYSS